MASKIKLLGPVKRCGCDCAPSYNPCGCETELCRSKSNAAEQIPSCDYPTSYSIDYEVSNGANVAAVHLELSSVDAGDGAFTYTVVALSASVISGYPGGISTVAIGGDGTLNPPKAQGETFRLAYCGVIMYRLGIGGVGYYIAINGSFTGRVSSTGGLGVLADGIGTGGLSAFQGEVGIADDQYDDPEVAYDDVPDCTGGHVSIANGSGVFSWAAFEERFALTGLTPGAWYCLKLTFEFSVIGAEAWGEDIADRDIYLQFEAEAAAETTDWVGLNVGALERGYEYRRKGSHVLFLDTSDGEESCESVEP
jgi:hypothetical protein